MTLTTIKGAPEPPSIVKARNLYYQHREPRRQLEVRLSMTDGGLAFLHRTKNLGHREGGRDGGHVLRVSS